MGLKPLSQMFEKVTVIDARGHLMGRLASFVAKEVLMGQKIVLVRCEELVISGSHMRNKLKLLMKRTKRMNTNPIKGPFHHKSPSDMMIRVIRGMLPHKWFRGSAAFQRVKAVEGVPEPFDQIKKVAAELGWGYADVVAQYEETRKAKGAEWYAKKK